MKMTIIKHFCKYCVELIERSGKYAIMQYDMNACMLSTAIDELWNPLDYFNSWDEANRYMNENIDNIL